MRNMPKQWASLGLTMSKGNNKARNIPPFGSIELNNNNGLRLLIFLDEGRRRAILMDQFDNNLKKARLKIVFGKMFRLLK